MNGKRITCCCKKCSDEMMFTELIFGTEDHRFYLLMACVNQLCDNHAKIQFLDVGVFLGEAKNAILMDDLADDGKSN